MSAMGPRVAALPVAESAATEKKIAAKRRVNHIGGQPAFIAATVPLVLRREPLYFVAAPPEAKASQLAPARDRPDFSARRSAGHDSSRIGTRSSCRHLSFGAGTLPHVFAALLSSASGTVSRETRMIRMPDETSETATLVKWRPDLRWENQNISGAIEGLERPRPTLLRSSRDGGSNPRLERNVFQFRDPSHPRHRMQAIFLAGGLFHHVEESALIT